MDEEDRYNIAYIAGAFDNVTSALRKVGSKWTNDKIPYCIHNTQDWFIVAHESYPAVGSHYAQFKSIEHAIRLWLWLTKKLGDDKNAPGPAFRWEWRKIQPAKQPEAPRMPEHEIALRNQLADYKKDLSIVNARLREADEKIKSLTLSLSAATSKGDKLAEMQKRLVELEEQNTRLIDESSRGYR